MSELINIAEEASIKPIISLKNVQLIEQSDSSSSSLSLEKHKSTEECIDEEREIEPQLVKINSQEAKEFMAKYGELKKKNNMLRSSKSKRFDSADYFIKNRNDKLKKKNE